MFKHVVAIRNNNRNDLEEDNWNDFVKGNPNDLENIRNDWSSQVSSKFVVYKFVVFSEILARNCVLVILEHH